MENYSDKEAAALSDKFNEAVKLKNQEEKLRQEIDTATKTAKEKTKFCTITKQEVLNQIAKLSAPKPNELMMEEKMIY